MNKTKALTACLAAAGAALAIVPAAQASGPAITHYKSYPSGSFVDDSLCSFPVTVNGVDHFTELNFANRTVFLDQFRGTVTANGVTLERYENARIVDDYATGTETWTGVAEGYRYPDGAIIAQDQGSLTFDPDGNIIAESGPHPIIDGPGADAVCAALSG